MRSPRLAFFALCLTASACVPKVGGLRDVQIDMPGAFRDDQTGEGDQALPAFEALFDDPNLLALIGDALENNQELLILGQEIQIGNAEVLARKGEYLPRLSLGVGAGVERVGEYTSQGASDEAHEIYPGKPVPKNLGDLQVAFAASWEVDLWGKLRNSKKAAQYRYLSSIEGRNFVVTQLVAEVAGTYYELVALDNQLDVVENYIELLQDSLEVVRLQKEAARVTELAVQRFEAELLENQARQYELRQQITEAEYRLNYLCGRYPQPVPRSSDRFASLTPPEFEAGLPASLLERRPDVRAAELELAASKLDVKATRAAFYPSLSLDAEFGLQAFSPAKLAALPESLLYSVAADLMAPLFNRAGLKAQYYTANAKQMQAVIGYERTVLQAYLEVAVQLALIGNLDESYQLRVQQVAKLEDAIETSSGLFQSARADYLEVLTTRRDSLDSQIELIETQRRQMGARIDLYRALGGGWTQDAEENP